MTNRLKVAVLMGGDSAERDISLKTGEQVMGALDPARYEAFPVDAARLREASDLSAVWPVRPDVVFIALHGPGGEDGAVQGLLEWMDLPYTGSGVLASALAMDKAMCKRVLRGEGIATPWSAVVAAPPAGGMEGYRMPLVVKPNRQGSSFGLTIVRNASELPAAIQLALRYDSECLLEEFVAGPEITVSVLGNRCPQALPIIEIVPKGEFYDFASKYEEGGSQHIIPARISPKACRLAEEFACRAHQALGCRGMSRTDLIVCGDRVTALEVNTIPGMTRTSLLPHAAAAAGIPFPDLLDRLIGFALEARSGPSASPAEP
ncbi:MAG TPA: D-alanine--D-alanine ligase [Armatimonadota bacterium]|jgi:D-alanine-D-alanine ligase